MAKHKHEEHENHERWLVSYADFITLLFAFFVVMYSASSVNIGKFKTISVAIQAAMKPVLGSTTSNQRFDVGSTQATNIPSITPKMQMMKKTQAAIIKLDVAQNSPNKIVISETEHGIKVTLADSMLFESGQATVLPGALPALQALSEVLTDAGDGVQEVRIEGYTDNVPMRTAQFPSNWELSAVRAVSVLRVLSEQFQVSPQFMSAVGFGDQHSMNDNISPEDRAKNRRVEINVVMKE